MEPEVEAVIAENNLRRQHKYRNGWNRADQRDENLWTMHDNMVGLSGQYLNHNMPYALCTVCEFLRKAM